MREHLSRSTPKARVAIAIAGALTILLASCSADKDDIDTSSLTESSTTTTTPSELTVAGDPTPIKLSRVATVAEPVAFATRKNDPAPYIASKKGKVLVLDIAKNGRADAERTLLDISDKVSQGSEQGLLGLVFSPNGTKLYINYTDTAGDTHIDEYSLNSSTKLSNTRREIMTVDQPYANHNGGQLAYGPDGYLYIALGDGGSGGDPQGNAQDRTKRLGKILRIDPTKRDRGGFGAPSTNPFVRKANALPEIWATGLRNPWRFSFDFATNEIWIADVGQGDIEEINRQSAKAAGVNYGWNRREGSKPYNNGEGPTGAADPYFEYTHEERGRCSVTGGYVYRGKKNTFPGGDYIYGDFCSGELWALRNKKPFALTPNVPNLSSFGQDNAGELYALSLSGQIYRFDPT